MNSVPTNTIATFPYLYFIAESHFIKDIMQMNVCSKDHHHYYNICVYIFPTVPHMTTHSQLLTAVAEASNML
jgi:hypothetical protein